MNRFFAMLLLCCGTACASSSRGTDSRAEAVAERTVQPEIVDSSPARVETRAAEDNLAEHPQLAPDISDAVDEPELARDIQPEEIAPEVVIPEDGIPFAPGPYGGQVFDTAGPFLLPTLDGDWDFEAEWGFGQDSYVFISHAVGYECIDELLSSPIADLLKRSPPNVHYFFMSYDLEAEAHVLAMKEKVEAALDELSPGDAQSWAPRFHFVTKSVHQMDHWLGEIGKTYGYFTFAIETVSSDSAKPDC